MFARMSEAQANTVDAVLDAIDREDWRFAFLHAELSQHEPPLCYMRGFLVVEGSEGAEKAPFSMAGDAIEPAIQDLHAAYLEGGNGFRRMDLVIEEDGRYRFEFDDTPSLILGGKPDPEGQAALAARFENLAARI